MAINARLIMGVFVNLIFFGSVSELDAQTFGRPDMVDTIREISPDLAGFTNSQGDLPIFQSISDANFLFAPPVRTADIGDGINVGTAQFGSGWCTFDESGCQAPHRVHLGTDLAVNAPNVNVYSMSDGIVVHEARDSSGWGCHIVIEHRLSDSEEYPAEFIVEWQDVNGNLLEIEAGEVITSDGRVLNQDEVVFPKSSEIREFQPGSDVIPFRYVYFDYQHIIPVGSNNADCNLAAENVRRGDLIGAIDGTQEVPHVHIHAKYAQQELASPLSVAIQDELMAGVAVYRVSDILRDDQLINQITRYREREGTLVNVNPLHLVYAERSQPERFPFIDVPVDQWYADFVCQAWRRGIVQGRGGGNSFVPDGNTNFAEFFKMLVEVSPALETVECEPGEQPVAAFNLDDSWYCGFYKAVARAGWLTEFLGLASERARPGQDIQRQEVAFFISRALGLESEEGAEGFSDVDESNPFRPAILRCQHRKICEGQANVQGQGNVIKSFQPGSSVNRAEMVAFLIRAFPDDEEGDDENEEEEARSCIEQ